MAWFYRYYARELSRNDATAYAEAEVRARREKRGLWADDDPIEPWNFRKNKNWIPVGPRLTVMITGPIIGNSASKIYHLINCPDYSKVADRNRVTFKTESEAQQAGYRKARNCP
jgi:hypothetical protein